MGKRGKTTISLAPRGTRGGGEAYESEEWFADDSVRAALYQKFRYDIEFYWFAKRLVETRMRRQIILNATRKIASAEHIVASSSSEWYSYQL